MTLPAHIQRLTARGFNVFSLLPNGKLPAIEKFPERATTDAKLLSSWFYDSVFDEPYGYNVGISTTRYGDGGLVVIDVDNKPGVNGKPPKNGSGELVKLEMAGFELPPTFTQRTPSGGLHLVFKAPAAVKQGVDVLGRGLDIRSHGGFIVGSGSTIEGVPYTDNGAEIADCPQWVIDKCGAPIERESISSEPPANIDQDRARERTIDYLRNRAPESIKGSGGDQTAYTVACCVKDFGVSQGDALDLMMEHWFDGSGWSPDRLAEKIAHAYRYGKHSVGSKSAAAQFKAVEVVDTPKPAEKPKAAEPSRDEHMANVFNRDHAFIIDGAGYSVLREGRNQRGEFQYKFLSEQTFIKYNTGKIVPIVREKTNRQGQKENVTEFVSLAKMWMDAPGRTSPPGVDDPVLWRRTYDGLWFAPPGIDCPDEYYNSWRGFRIDAAPAGSKAEGEAAWAVNEWLTHIRQNICGDDKDLAHWLVGWIAHLFQKPGERPLTTVVIQGAKGTGKNSFTDAIAGLIGSAHAKTFTSERFLTGQFNGHLDALLFMVLDEAVWAGSHSADSILKGLTTGDTNYIEQKGKEIYPCPNLVRTVILGNAEWLVPASDDERRYAVFVMGKKRQKDGAYFKRIKAGMQAGGYEHLMRYLLDFDLTTVDINVAPATDALLQQKVESLGPVEAWWLTCLTRGTIVESDFGPQGWPETIEPPQFYSAVRRYMKTRNIRAQSPTDNSIQRVLNKICAPLTHGRSKTATSAGVRPYVYFVPPLDHARQAWAKHIGHDITWSQQP